MPLEVFIYGTGHPILLAATRPEGDLCRHFCLPNKTFYESQLSLSGPRRLTGVPETSPGRSQETLVGRQSVSLGPTEAPTDAPTHPDDTGTSRDSPKVSSGTVSCLLRKLRPEEGAYALWRIQPALPQENCVPMKIKDANLSRDPKTRDEYKPVAYIKLSRNFLVPTKPPLPDGSGKSLPSLTPGEGPTGS